LSEFLFKLIIEASLEWLSLFTNFFQAEINSLEKAERWINPLKIIITRTHFFA